MVIIINFGGRPSPHEEPKNPSYMDVWGTDIIDENEKLISVARVTMMFVERW